MARIVTFVAAMIMAILLQDALAAEYSILSSAGSHAREDWRTIVTRKSADIATVKHSVWVLNSNAARPDAVQSFCNEHKARYVIFVSRERNGKPNVGPSTEDKARLYSPNNRSWFPLDPALSHVTGKLNRGTTGIWLDALEEVPKGTLNLGCFHKQSDGEILSRFQLHESTYPVRRVIPACDGGYQILAVGRLVSPFAVWLKT
jgi:hypothetical protein